MKKQLIFLAALSINFVACGTEQRPGTAPLAIPAKRAATILAEQQPIKQSQPAKISIRDEARTLIGRSPLHPDGTEYLEKLKDRYNTLNQSIQRHKINSTADFELRALYVQAFTDVAVEIHKRISPPTVRDTVELRQSTKRQEKFKLGSPISIKTAGLYLPKSA